VAVSVHLAVCFWGVRDMVWLVLVSCWAAVNWRLVRPLVGGWCIKSVSKLRPPGVLLVLVNGL
jgi:hypothetical protein